MHIYLHVPQATAACATTFRSEYAIYLMPTQYCLHSAPAKAKHLTTAAGHKRRRVKRQTLLASVLCDDKSHTQGPLLAVESLR